MFKLSDESAKTLLSLHGRFAVSLGLLLYVLVLTGMASVFAPEIADWSSPLETRQHVHLPAGLDRALHTLATQVDPKYLNDVSVSAQAGGRVQAFFHTHETHSQSGDLEKVGIEFDLDPLTFAILDRREGWADDIKLHNATSGLATFLKDLHVRMHIPEPYGLIVTGILGLSLMVAVVSGFLMHRHILRDLFTRRGRGNSPLAARDTHIGAASWVLPFALILAFTGSFFSFAESFGLPALARVNFNGNSDRLLETMIGVPPPEDARLMVTANIDAMIADAANHSTVDPDAIKIERWGRADTRVSVFVDPAEGNLTTLTYVYAGVDGRLVNEKPTFGLVPSTSGTLIDVISALHHGDFAGVWSKTVWVGLGFGVAFVALTGLLLWCRRRSESRAWRRMARAVHWVGYGLPLALAVTPYGYFPARAAGVAQTSGAMTVAFVGAAVFAAVLAFALRELGTIKRALLGLTGVALIGLPLLRLLTGGPGWAAALHDNLDTVVGLDAAFALVGVTCILIAWRQPRIVATHSGLPRPASAVAEAQ